MRWLRQAQTPRLFMPAPFAKDGILEAANAGIKLIVCITEVSTLDMLVVKALMDEMGWY